MRQWKSNRTFDFLVWPESKPIYDKNAFYQLIVKYHSQKQPKTHI